MITITTEDAYKAEIENQIPSVQSDLQAQCTNILGRDAPMVVMSETFTFIVVGSKVCIIVAP